MTAETSLISLDVLAHSVRGALEIEPVVGGFSPSRLPLWTRTQQADSDIERMASHTSAVTLRVITAATALGLDLTFSRSAVRGRQPAQSASVMCEVDGTIVSHVEWNEGTVIVTSADKTSTTLPGHPSLVLLPLGGDGAREREVTVWLPQAAAVTIHGGAADAPVRPAPRGDALQWTHYGSSISHGFDADHATGPWPIQAARQLGWELTNLSLAENAMLDPFVARVIAERPTDLISLKVGLNLVTGDAMRRRTFIPALHGFLDRIRDAQPNTPIALITALGCPILEDETGPALDVLPAKTEATPRHIPVGDGSLTLTRTREIVAEVAAAREDPLLTVVDGLSLFGLDDADMLVDNIHPNQDGHDLIAQRFVALASNPGSTFGESIQRLSHREPSLIRP
jgi:lysophospholipase L1-like esterase